jgi:ubiquinol-cytochrome c reductase cytochrome c1 subunit
MKKTIVWSMLGVLLAALASGPLLAAPSSIPLDPARIDVSDQESLQRGARLFVNYCMGCHSAEYMRYNRVARDLGLEENQVIQSMIFTTNEDGERDAIGSLMTNAITAAYGDEAFGKAPPDLTLVARVRGTDWLYTFLRSFYVDESRLFGANNLVYENIGMPHVLWELQGWQQKVVNPDGSLRLQPVAAGWMTGPEYDRAIRDLVAFLSYLGEPMQLERQRLGVYVILFLLIFLVFAILLKKEYWKDVH